MSHVPVRIKRETIKIESSKIHWVEKVKYQMIFACDGEREMVKDGIKEFIDAAIRRYEIETFRIRNRAFEKNEKGMDKTVSPFPIIIIIVQLVICVWEISQIA